jgi:hypothetical protein
MAGGGQTGRLAEESYRALPGCYQPSQSSMQWGSRSILATIKVQCNLLAKIAVASPRSGMR